MTKNKCDSSLNSKLIRLESCLLFISDPTHIFVEGELVIANSKIWKIKESLYGGKVYKLEILEKDNGEETYLPWYSVYPYGVLESKSNFTVESLLRESDLQTYSKSIDELINTYVYSFGVNMEPSYQREYVWNENDKEKLIDSLFNSNISIGSIVLAHNDYSKSDYGYDILDGKQRLSTIKDFFESRIVYKGYRYSELSAKDKKTIMNKPISLSILKHADEIVRMKTFINLNSAGKIMDESHIEMVKKQLSEKLQER